MLMGPGILSAQSSAELSRPRQVVVLAGGRGTRLAPISDLRPKPMALLQGRPFLEHSILDLRNQGFQRFLVLTGYEAQAIERKLGDGSRLGVEISYSVAPISSATGHRLAVARKEIDSHFLLTYCDNFWPVDFPAMWREYVRTDAMAQLTIYRNADGYTRSNVRVDDNGLIVRYDRQRTSDNLNGVEIGYGLFQKQVLDLISSDAQCSFEAEVYPELVRQKQLRAFVTDQRYYSIGGPHRLADTERFLAAPPTVLLDRDGVLNAKMPKATYVESWNDWQWLPGALDALRVFHQSGVRVIVITNQAGVARGNFSRQELDRIHVRMAEEVERAGGYIDAIYVCDHGWDDGCQCRKPRPGMLLEAQRDFALSLRDTPYVGDDSRDAEAARAAGCPFIEISDSFQLNDAAPQIVTRFSESWRNLQSRITAKGTVIP